MRKINFSLFLSVFLLLAFTSCDMQKSGQAADETTSGHSTDNQSETTEAAEIEEEAPITEPKAGITRFMYLSQASKGIKIAVIDYNPATHVFLDLHHEEHNHAGEWDSEGIAEFTTTMKESLHAVMAKYYVPGNNVRLFASSGFKRQVGPTLWDEYYKTVTGWGYMCEAVTPQREAYYGFITAIPPAYRPMTNFHDIGGSNVKMHSGDNNSSMPFGSRTSSDVDREEIRSGIKKSISKLPNYTSRKKMAFFGGGPFIVLCVINPKVIKAKKHEMPFVDFTQDELNKAETKIRNDWEQLINDGLPSFYTQEQVLNALFIMKEYTARYAEEKQAKDPAYSPELLFVNQIIDWTAGITAAYVLKK